MVETKNKNLTGLNPVCSVSMRVDMRWIKPDCRSEGIEPQLRSDNRVGFCWCVLRRIESYIRRPRTIFSALGPSQQHCHAVTKGGAQTAKFSEEIQCPVGRENMFLPAKTF